MSDRTKRTPPDAPGGANRRITDSFRRARRLPFGKRSVFNAFANTGAAFRAIVAASTLVLESLATLALGVCLVLALSFAAVILAWLTMGPRAMVA